MAEVSSSVSVLPWIWTIETLASDKEIDASFIFDVIEMAPQLPDDLGKNMIEIVALRCLEGLYDPSNKVPLVLDSKVRFDPSESCESVLRLIFGKAPSNLRMDGSEQMKLDIHSFILHKRASMPKCTLQQLKDTILEGTHKYVATFKDLSGLAFTNECRTTPSDNSDCDALPQRPNESRTDIQSNREKQNSVPQTLEDGYKQLEKASRNINSLASDRDRFELATEKVVGGIPENHVVKAQKRKHNDSFAIISEDEPCQNITINEIKINSMCPAEPQTFSGAPPERTDQETHESSSTHKHDFQMKTSTNASCDESWKKDSTNEPKDDMDDCLEAETLDFDGYGVERVDVVMMKNQFLSSQFTLNPGPSAIADWTEQNLCVKCNEGGRLLACNSHGCHMAVHEDCLGSSARFYDQGNFYCPFCTYSVAISEYLEAKKKASLARKRLATFMGSNFEHRSKGHTERLPTKEGNPRQDEDEDIVEVVQNGCLKETEGNQVSGTGDHINEVNDNNVQLCVDDKQQSESLVSCAKVNLPCREEAIVSSLISHVSSKEQQGEDMMVPSCLDVRATEGEEKRVPADRRCDIGKFHCENREAVHVKRRHSERRAIKEKTFDKFFNSFDSNKRRRTQNNHMFPALPQLRRTRLPFTAEEEEIIRVGVSRFASGNDKTIPWKTILEFGANVFLNGRSTIDIKDKWRNMCKGSPKSQ